MTAYEHLVVYNQNGFDIAIENMGRAGVQVINGIKASWDCTFEKGVRPTNYVGDILGSLEGTPDFGLGSLTGNRGFAALWQDKRKAKRGRIKR